MLGTESLDGAYTHWNWGNGHKTSGQKSTRARAPGQKTPRTTAPRTKIPRPKVRPKVLPGKRPPGKKSLRAKHPPDKNSPGPGHPTSGDIFYCSGSRQLNHSGFTCDRSLSWHGLLWASARMFTGSQCLGHVVIAVVGGSFSKQMTLNVDLDFSIFNGEIWRTCRTSVPNFTKNRLLL